MSRIVWDRPGTRRYENGLDRGVLYPPNSPGVPWNGLTGVAESSGRNTDPVYFDGVKVNDGVTAGSFSAKLTCVTYPEELDLLEGGSRVRRGVVATEQPPETFALCYRTREGTDTAGPDRGYKIHVMFNVVALPDDRDYASTSEDIEIVEFGWELVTTPEHIPGMAPTSHLVLDTRKLDPWLLEEVEKMLYGSSEADASLLPVSEFVSFLRNWFRIRITDNGDGTWTAEEVRPGFIHLYGPGDIFFLILQANATFVDAGTYIISDTSDMAELMKMAISDNGDGTWTASTDIDVLIEVDEETGIFKLHDVDPIFSGPTMFRLADQLPDET